MSHYVYTAGEIAERAKHNPDATFVLATDYDALRREVQGLRKALWRIAEGRDLDGNIMAAPILAKIAQAALATASPSDTPPEKSHG